MNAADVVTYLTAITLLLAMLGGAYRGWKNHQRDKKDIDAALDRQPEIRQQLEIGNFRGAIEALNLIITTQGEQLQIERDETKDVRAELKECQEQCDQLKVSNGRLEESNDRIVESNKRLEHVVRLLMAVLEKHDVPVPEDIKAII